uniref:Uncharacterized protein n=2 Tax=Euplotes crassus TaxID=5936 RepID=A0A7S3KSB4_EUPCR|mmetsp:Transcript_37012/g.36613  ORF Transcript_37012/g.36613 Transcript_37012/m.36613 type:complete len:1181 (+) Transcript_37012:371-3913(+)
MYKMSDANNKKYQKGKMHNLMGQDCGRVCHLVWQIPHMTSMPMLILTTFYSLYLFVGHIVWIPVTILFASLALCYCILIFNIKLEKKRRKDDDNRSTILSEIIENIKVLKMNSWVNCFEKKLNDLRKKEHYNDLIGRLIWMPHHAAHWLTYYLMVVSVFYVCILGYNMKLTVPTAVAIWRLIGKVKWHTGWIPGFANFYTEFKISIKRIADFLTNDEIEEHITELKNYEEEENAIEIKKSSFFWGFDHIDSDESDDEENEDTSDKDKQNQKEKIQRKDSSETDSTNTDDEKKVQDVNNKVALKDVELKIKKNEFVAIIGDVGSGKSSLINTLLKETLYVDDETLNKYGNTEIDDKKEKKIKLEKKSNNDTSPGVIDQIMDFRSKNTKDSSARISVAGSISLVQQKPFILSQTIRENILFGEELDEDRYNRIVQACQLGSDLEILEGGDLTQIGEKGVNLSGGQKARLSIARAVYANRDIVLMDDPLSALDAHVKRLIFDEVCCEELKDRTRIIVTHAVDFLDRVDRIIVVEKGKIKLNGTYDELINEGYFEKVMKTITKKNKEDEDENSSASDDSCDKEEKKKNYLSQKEKKLLEDQDDKEIEVTKSTYLQYFMYLKQGLIFMGVGIAIQAFIRMCNMRADYLLLKWVQDFTQNKVAEFEAIKYVAIYVFLMISVDLSGWIIDIVQNYLIDKKIFAEMFEKMVNAPINLFFDKMPSSLITKRFSADLNSSSRDLPHTIKWNVRNLIVMCMTISFVTYTAPVCLLVIPCAIFLYSLVMRGYMTTDRQISRLFRKSSTASGVHFGESVEGISTIRAFKKIEQFEAKRFWLKDREHSLAILDRGLNSWLCMRLMSISMIFIIFLYIYCIVYRDSQDTVIIGLLMGYVIELQWNMREFVHEITRIHIQMASFDKCKKITEIPQEAAQRLPVPKDENGEQWMSKGRVEFKDFSLRYREDTEVVLKKINLSIKAGEKVGIVGRTGAGKSTLCLALCRIIEALRGSIEIDGVDISKVGLADLRDRITIIPQEPVLFKNTLKFNLDPENKCSDKEIKDMLRRANLGDLLTRDGKGVNFKITEKGENLSAGEKALICICRAALRKNKVILMDEATANIDVNTEETIQKLINQEFKDSTVITVAHRLNTIMKSDKIAVMSFGEVAEFGSPEKLLEDKKSHFTEMVNRFNE